MTGETLAATRLIQPAVIDARRVELHCPRSERHFTSLAMTIAHHQGAPLLVTLAAMALEVIIDFSLECLEQHPPCTLARDLVQPHRLLTRLPSIPFLDYLQHRWRLPSNPATTGRLRCSRRRVRRLFHARITSTTFGNNSARRLPKPIPPPPAGGPFHPE